MTIEETIFFIFIIQYLFYYGPSIYQYRLPPVVIDNLLKLYFLAIKFFEYYNKNIHPDYWQNENIDEQNNTETLNDNNLNTFEEKPVKRYEDKYLDDIRRLNKEWEFTNQELYELPIMTNKLYNNSKQNIIDKMKDIEIEIINLKKEIDEDNDNTVNYVEDYDEEGDELIRETTMEERNKVRLEQIEIFKQEYEKNNIQVNTSEGLEDLKYKCQQQSRQTIINRRLEKLDNCYVIEKTPVGNVLMIYDGLNRFKYYSDATIPYRYLEVVGRKYVKLFNCRPIFIDMEEELKLFEEKWEKEQELKSKKEEEKKLKLSSEESKETTTTETKKKNVFAKFKSYNNESGSKISMAPPPKNSIPNISITENKENEKILLKEKANCYSYAGKISNFNFLKKVEKKVFNKKLGFTFADFKKMNLQKKII